MGHVASEGVAWGAAVLAAFTVGRGGEELLTDDAAVAATQG